jgi:SNF2 family DNA or RNA helicase
VKIFQFNKSTAPTARHKRIAEFQHGTAPGAKVFIVTYQTAAVGITLTAATRVHRDLN